MKLKHYFFDIDESCVDEMSENEYLDLSSKAQDVFETTEEHGNYVFILEAINEAGKHVWLGFK